MTKEILNLTIEFHNTYERLAKEYNYKTREDTKKFNIKSSNGKLMYATVSKIVTPILYENKKFKKEKQELIDYLKEEINKVSEQIRNYDLWHEVGTDVNFLILRKQMFKEILNKIEKR